MVSTGRFKQNQALFQKYNAVYGYLRNTIIQSIKPVFLSPTKGEFTGFGQVVALEMTDNLFGAYRVIDEIGLEENSVCMVGVYHLVEPLARLIK